MRLERKTALITGAGVGIGQAAAILFAREGADVAVANLDLAEAEETAAAVRSIVNVSSRTGISGVPNINAYGPSKAAVINMTR